jgi:hypothetical protein
MAPQPHQHWAVSFVDLAVVTVHSGWQWTEHVLLGRCLHSFFGEVSVKLFGQLYQVVLLLSFKCSLYILDSSPSLDHIF